MARIKLREMGTTAGFIPNMKRATAHTSDGRTVLVVVDNNRSDANGDDVTGVAKFHVYRTNTARTTATLETSITPPVAPCNNTKFFVGSFAIGSTDTIYIAWQGTDNSLRLTSATWNGTSYDAAVHQTIAVGTAVTNRYRAIDIDVTTGGTGDNPAVIAYESKASAGPGLFVRIYIRLNDGATWRKAVELDLASVSFIKAGGEDVSIAYNAAGVVSNVAQFAVYYTRTFTTLDEGDSIREYSFNVSTGVDNGGTLIGSWSTTLHKNIASGQRRGWLFSRTTDQWVFATAVGTSVPFFSGSKLAHNTFTAPVQNKIAAIKPTDVVQQGIAVYRDINVNTAVSAEYSDNVLMFGFVGAGLTISRAARAVVMRWSSSVNVDSVEYKDSLARMLDRESVGTNGQILGVYAGANRFISTAQKQLNFLIIYGANTNTVSSSEDVLEREAWFVSEDTVSAPTILYPKSTTIPTDIPVLQVSTKNNQKYTNVLGKVEWQIDNDSAFGSPVTITQANDQFITYSSGTGGDQPTRTVTHQVVTADGLASGTWFIRARIVDDLGGTGAWSTSQTFTISHPPIPIIMAPTPNKTIRYTAAPLNTNPYFESTVSPWTCSGGTIVRSTAQFHEGVAAGLITPNGVSASVKARGGQVLVTPGTSYTVSSWLRCASSRNVVVGIDWYTSGGAYISTSFTTQAVVANTWTLASVAATAPATAERGEIIVEMTGTPPGSDLLYIDESTLGLTPGDVAFSWQFTDPYETDTQSAYQVIVTRTDTGATVSDTGKVISSNQSVIINISSTLKDIPLQFTVTLWDSDDVQGAASNPQLFTVADPPTVTLTQPAEAAVVNTALPVFQWTFSAGGVRTQRAFRIVVYNTVPNPDVIVADSGWRFSTATSFTFPSQILVNAGSYKAEITVQDSEGMEDPDDNSFTTSWTAPALGNISLAADKFKVTVSWTDVNLDAEFVSWRVYRRYNPYASVDLDVDNERLVWVLVHETDNNGAAVQFLDYFAPLNKSIDYVVVQMVDRFGSLIESNISSFSSITAVGERYYVVPEFPLGVIASFEASNVVGDSFSHETERETLHILGRGRQVQVGDTLGYSGTLTFHLRNPASAQADRQFLERLASDKVGNVYLRSPFGDVLYVSFGDPSFNRLAGTGLSDMGDLTLPYVEVFQEELVTRTV